MSKVFLFGGGRIKCTNTIIYTMRFHVGWYKRCRDSFVDKFFYISLVIVERGLDKWGRGVFPPIGLSV